MFECWTFSEKGSDFSNALTMIVFYFIHFFLRLEFGKRLDRDCILLWLFLFLTLLHKTIESNIYLFNVDHQNYVSVD